MNARHKYALPQHLLRKAQSLFKVVDVLIYFNDDLGCLTHCLDDFRLHRVEITDYVFRQDLKIVQKIRGTIGSDQWHISKVLDNFDGRGLTLQADDCVDA